MRAKYLFPASRTGRHDGDAHLFLLLSGVRIVVRLIHQSLRGGRGGFMTIAPAEKRGAQMTR